MDSNVLSAIEVARQRCLGELRAIEVLNSRTNPMRAVMDSQSNATELVVEAEQQLKAIATEHELLQQLVALFDARKPSQAHEGFTLFCVLFWLETEYEAWRHILKLLATMSAIEPEKWGTWLCRLSLPLRSPVSKHVENIMRREFAAGQLNAVCELSSMVNDYVEEDQYWFELRA